LTFNDIEGAHYDACPLGHAKLDTTALYTRVATKTIREVMSPLEHIARKLGPKGERRGYRMYHRLHICQHILGSVLGFASENNCVQLF
jgi:hypothetical protein